MVSSGHFDAEGMAPGVSSVHLTNQVKQRTNHPTHVHSMSREVRIQMNGGTVEVHCTQSPHFTHYFFLQRVVVDPAQHVSVTISVVPFRSSNSMDSIQTNG